MTEAYVRSQSNSSSSLRDMNGMSKRFGGALLPKQASMNGEMSSMLNKGREMDAHPWPPSKARLSVGTTSRAPTPRFRLTDHR